VNGVDVSTSGSQSARQRWVGEEHTGTHVILLVQDLHVSVAHAITSELLRELTVHTSTHAPRADQCARTAIPSMMMRCAVDLDRRLGSMSRASAPTSILTVEGSLAP
jgi:hypothetical protein